VAHFRHDTARLLLGLGLGLLMLRRCQRRLVRLWLRHWVHAVCAELALRLCRLAHHHCPLLFAGEAGLRFLPVLRRVYSFWVCRLLTL